MCPFRYLYHVLLFLLSNALLSSCVEWKAQFDPDKVTVKTSSKQKIHLILSGLSDETIANIDDRAYLQLRSENEELATVKNQQEVKFFELDQNEKSWGAYFDLNGVFLGKKMLHKFLFNFIRKFLNFYFLIKKN